MRSFDRNNAHKLSRRRIRQLLYKAEPRDENVPEVFDQIRKRYHSGETISPRQIKEHVREDVSRLKSRGSWVLAVNGALAIVLVVFLVTYIAIPLLSGQTPADPTNSVPAETPDQVINEYWKAVQDGNYETSRTMIASGREKKVLHQTYLPLNGRVAVFLEMESERPILYQLTIQAGTFASGSGPGDWRDGQIDISATDYSATRDTAMVDVSLTIPDIAAALLTFHEDLSSLWQTSASPEEMLNQNMQLLFNNMRDSRTVTFDETAEMVLENGEWKIYDWHFDNFEQSLMDMKNEINDFVFK